jgi:hypothetical protein
MRAEKSGTANFATNRAADKIGTPGLDRCKATKAKVVGQALIAVPVFGGQAE